MLTRDILAARSEELPEDLSPEEIYAALFLELKETHQDFKDWFHTRQMAWRRGMIMRRSQMKGRSPAQLRKIQEYLAWLNQPADVMRLEDSSIEP